MMRGVMCGKKQEKNIDVENFTGKDEGGRGVHNIFCVAIYYPSEVFKVGSSGADC